MRILLACLMCLVLTVSECFALKGGPIYPAATNLIGTYAGVLQGVFDPTDPASSNSIGVFSLGIPETGLSTGTFIMFSRGRVFTGDINAVGDPDKATLQGILQATFDFNLQVVEIDDEGNPQVVSVPITATANGPINADIVAPKSSNLFTTAAVRVDGEAVLSITGGFVSGETGEPIVTSVLQLTVDGFKQSDVAPTTAAAPAG